MLPLTRSRNRARFFGIPFSPEALFAGVNGVFYDISDLTTLFTTSAGTTQCAMPGGGSAVVVGRMLDKSGNGNHAIAFNDTTARPELRARVNLLERSEEFGNAYWSRDGVTISANTTATTDPLGGNTADKITEESTSAAHVVYTTSAISASAIQYTLSVYVKAAERTFARLDFVTVGYTAGATVILNLSTLATTITNYGATSGTTATVTTVGNGWYRLVVTLTATAASYFAQIGPAISGTPANYTGNGTSGIFIWGADLRPANIGANVPAYQRIADANTYDTSGFPLYVFFDGVDDRMLTASNFPFTGDPTFTCFWSQNRQTTSSVGTFGWGSTGTALAAAGHFFLSGVNGSFAYAGANGFNFATDNANEPAVYSYAKTPGAINTTSSARRNGANNNGVGSSSNTPNISSLPLYIGAWGNLASNFFNGHLYSLIIAGSAVSASNISATEQWVAGKTGITI
jgi:hypothetical protein